MSILDISALTAVLKQKYSPEKVKTLTYPNNPFWAMVSKSTDFGGINKVIALRNGTPQGRSATFSSAQTFTTPSAYNRFVITRTRDYALAVISGEAIRASKGNENALVEGLEQEIDGAMITATRSLAVAAWHNGGGARGQISSTSTVSTATITLSNVADITNFEVGMTLQTATTDGTSGSVLPGFVTVTGLDRDLGTITVSANWNTGIPSVATSNFIFQHGDFGAMVTGVPGWVPVTAPTSSPFFGLDRTSDVTRLSGVRLSQTAGAQIEETLVELSARIVAEGGRPDTAFLNPRDYSNLIKALGSKVIYSTVQSFDMPQIGFEAVTVMGPGGPIKVVHEINAPRGFCWMMQMDTWKFNSLGKAPGILEEDGQMILRRYNDDSYEVRIGYYGQFSNSAPGWNGVAIL